MPKKSPTRSVRFNPDHGTLAKLIMHFSPSRTENLLGLVHNESRTGCAVVLVGKFTFTEGLPCVCKVGELPYTEAVLRWSKEIARDVWQVGLEYKLEG
jgi:hypothetical protein